MNLSNSPWLHNLIYTASEVGKSKCPTPYEISNVYLEAKYKEMLEWINGMKKIWQERGATIMCDGWTDNINHTHIMNLLVYCHKGTVFWKSVDASDVDSRNTDYYFQFLDKVVEEVGEDCVVQVVTDNEAALKAAGQKLMEKRPHLYWSSCVAHCLDLFLEDIEKKKNIHNLLSEAKMVSTFIYNHTYIVSLMKKYTGGRDIVCPGVTRFATQFLQLQAIVRQKQGLENMFSSEEFRKTKYGKEKKGPGYEARKIVMSRDFWIKTNDILKVFEPIVKVLRLVDGDEKTTTGFIYEAIDRAKQVIQQNSCYYSKYNDIIDKHWKFMHSDLHFAGYFLNPRFQYGIEHGIVVYKEIFNGTKNVITKLERNIDNQIKALNQLTLFREKSETFGTPIAQKSWSKMDAAQWWEYHGSCAPELQRLAMKVVSQTTFATNCERNWSIFSYIHTKTRNRLKYKKLHKLVFTHYNMKLRMRDKLRKSQEEIEANFDPINLDYIFQEDPLSHWIEERENPLLDGVQNAEWLPIVDTDDENVDDNSESNESGGGISPPSGNKGDGGGNEVANEGYKRYRNLNDMVRADNSLLETRGNVSQSGRKGKRKQNVPLEDSSSSSIANSFSDFGIGDSSQDNQ
ncbi:uncharacterized protein LOC131604090 [Vicia villosa]|uniref:uncharacterized protein LOC131604090 n=1 Tax=Vicia villosa TaxID=3911 RepID=UPI00273C0353|nr:uncharacterized protein LOC131604090 [Vicia villosa]